MALGVAVPKPKEGAASRPARKRLAIALRNPVPQGGLIRVASRRRAHRHARRGTVALTPNGQLNPVTQSDKPTHIAHVNFYGRLSQLQRSGNFSISVSTRNERKDLVFAGRELTFHGATLNPLRGEPGP